MTDRPKHIVLCSCDDTMPLDADARAARLPRCQGRERTQLCRAELERFRGRRRRRGRR